MKTATESKKEENNMEKIRVYDKPGTMDRYTIIVGEAVFGMSEYPNSAQGFNQYVGDFPSRNYPTVRGFGKRIQWADVPEEVKIAIERRISGK